MPIKSVSISAANIFGVFEDTDAEIPSVKKALKKLREIDALLSKGRDNLSAQELEKVSQERHWKSFLPGFIQEICQEKQPICSCDPSPKKLKRMAEKAELRRRAELEKERKEAERKRREEYEREQIEEERKRRKQQEESERKQQKQENKKRKEEMMKNPVYAMEIEFQEKIKCGLSIDSAFRQLSLKYHPDKNGGKDQMQKILLDLKEKIIAIHGFA